MPFAQPSNKVIKTLAAFFHAPSVGIANEDDTGYPQVPSQKTQAYRQINMYGQTAAQLQDQPHPVHHESTSDEQDSKSEPSSSQQPGRHNGDDDNEGDGHEGDDDDDDDDHLGEILGLSLGLGLPALGGGLALLKPLTSFAEACIDPVLCEAPVTRPYLQKVFQASGGLLGDSSFLSHLFTSSSSATAPSPPRQPKPTPPTSAELENAEKVGPNRLYRVERYDPETRRLEQQTYERAQQRPLTEDAFPELRDVDSDDDKKLEEAGHAQHSMWSREQLNNLGYQPYYKIDANGFYERATYKSHGEKGRRLVWHLPDHVEPLEGDWRRVRTEKAVRYMRYENGRPALSSQGEPLIRAENKILNTAEPAESSRRVRFNE